MREKTNVEEVLGIASSASQVRTTDIDDDADNKSIRSEVSASLGGVIDSLAADDPYSNGSTEPIYISKLECKDIVTTKWTNTTITILHIFYFFEHRGLP